MRKALLFAALLGCASPPSRSLPPPAPPPVTSPPPAASPRATAADAAPSDPILALLDALARFEPEAIGSMGIQGKEDEVADIAPDSSPRQLDALAAASAQINAALAHETEQSRRQDLAIAAKAARRYAQSEEFTERRFVPNRDVAKTIFVGLMQHLRPGGDPAHALARLRKYAGGFATRARQRVESKLASPGNASLVWPTRSEIEQRLANSDVYLAEVQALFEKVNPSGWREPFGLMKADVTAYNSFVRSTLLPRARTDFKLPLDVYDHYLKEAGVDMGRSDLAARARAAFAKTKVEMRALSAGRDYRVVLREQRAKKVSSDELVPLYTKRVAELEDIVRRERLVTLPSRPIHVRLATPGETAQNPSPTIDVQALFKKDEVLSFLLPVAGPPTPGQTSAAYDDFAYPAISWTLAAHEARPGHELQFSIMKEHGLSVARTLFAFNSANVEGWGLYAETIAYPFMPADGKLSSLRMRALREARAFLDPGLHEGTVTLDEARRTLAEDLAFGEGVVRQELDRYTFLSPAQATTYFYGLEKMRELRVAVETKLGKAFDARVFHDTVLAQGLLSPDLLREAVLADLSAPRGPSSSALPR